MLIVGRVGRYCARLLAFALLALAAVLLNIAFNAFALLALLWLASLVIQ